MFQVKILNKDNNEVTKSKELGRIVIKLPLPPGTLNTLWENDDLFKSLYFEKFPGHYDTADIGFKTADGYISVLSRADDVINVAGHRLSCSAIEEVTNIYTVLKFFNELFILNVIFSIK